MKEIKGKCQVTGEDLDELADIMKAYIETFSNRNYSEMDEIEVYRLHSLRRVYKKLKSKAIFNGKKTFAMTFDMEELLTIKTTLLKLGNHTPAMRRMYLLIDPIVHPGIQLQL